SFTQTLTHCATLGAFENVMIEDMVPCSIR
ncbi:unnamed protein product, partial [marine sediment metagenome]